MADRDERRAPVLTGAAATDYERYLRTDELLSLQKTAAEVVHRDEHLFQAVHQASELWLKLACLEIEAATTLIDAAKAAAGASGAARLRRDAAPHESARDAGAHVSLRLRHRPHGARSRRGLRLPRLPPVHKVSPLLGEAFEGLLTRAGLTLLEVYERGHELDDVYQLAEQMMTWDERTILWRFQHLKTVERIIGGNVIGTQGTPVDVLGKRIDVRFFPDLWLVRDEITRRSALGTDGHGR